MGNSEEVYVGIGSVVKENGGRGELRVDVGGQPDKPFSFPDLYFF